MIWFGVSVMLRIVGSRFWVLWFGWGWCFVALVVCLQLADLFGLLVVG